MRWVLSIWIDPTDEAIRSVGRFILAAAFTLILILIVYTVWSAGTAVFIWPLLLLAPPLLWALFHRPLLNLAVVIAAFALVAGYKEGIQITEVLYGLYYLAFLAHWFGTRVFIYKENILEHAEDKAVLFFLVAMTCSIPLTFLFGGSATGLLSEWSALVLIAFYFPVKEACLRHKHGPAVILSLLIALGLFASIRNILIYKTALSNVEYMFQVARGRVYFNDNLIMVSSLVTMVVLSYLHGWKRILPMAGLFLLLMTGLILTQSRAFWMSFLLGAAVMFLFADRTQKRRLVVLTGWGLGCFVILAVLFLGEYVELVLFGLVDRFASIATAATRDLSLINRFRESAAVFERIVRNPILGYGMAVPYTFFDLAHMSTDKDAFAHNGYLLLWYKFGIWGLGLVLFAWFKTTRQGLAAIRLPSTFTSRVASFAAAVSLSAMMLSTVTSNPFFLMDGTIIFGVLTGLAGGAYRRARRDMAFSEGEGESASLPS